MTQKDYVLIASIIRGLADPFVRGVVARAFARVLPTDNPRFNSLRFLEACGVKEKVFHPSDAAGYIVPEESTCAEIKHAYAKEVLS
jgi:hypothetical protein